MAPNNRHHSAFLRLQRVQEGTARPLTPPCVPGERVAASAQHPTHRIHALELILIRVAGKASVRRLMW